MDALSKRIAHQRRLKEDALRGCSDAREMLVSACIRKGQYQDMQSVLDADLSFALNFARRLRNLGVIFTYRCGSQSHEDVSRLLGVDFNKHREIEIPIRIPLRWDLVAARHFSFECAEKALPEFEKAYPTVKIPRATIEAARRYFRGRERQYVVSELVNQCVALSARLRHPKAKAALMAARNAAILSPMWNPLYVMRSVSTAFSPSGVYPCVETMKWQKERALDYLLDCA